MSTDCVTDAEPWELIGRARRGDTEAFGDLVDLYRRPVYRAALAALGSASDAEDAAQDAFVSAFRRLESFRGESSFKTWLLSITWRKALDRRQSTVRWLRLIVTPRRDEGDDDTRFANPLVDRAPSAEPDQEQALLQAELARHIGQLAQSLPPKLRDALLLAASGEYSYEEIGVMLRAPVGTVKWRVSEARRVLKVKLAALGYGGK